MSKKPTLTIRYPEASEKALKLTEAMVKRSPGKRTVETESEDPIFPDGGDLFSSFIRCKTSTGVDLTLTLNPASMDFALETLIRPNLNAEERRRILGESEDEEQAELGLDGGAQAAQTPGQALDGSSSPDVPSAEREAATQSGEPVVPAFSYKTYALFGIILSVSLFLKPTKKPSDINTLQELCRQSVDFLRINNSEAENGFFSAYMEANQAFHSSHLSKVDLDNLIEYITEKLYDQDYGIERNEPAGESDQDSDIEPGLLNDLDEDKKERGEDEQ